jgi:hypothetical protein
MTPAHWPATWQAESLDTYRKNMLRDHDVGQWLLEAIQAGPVTLPSLGDGEIGWWCYDEMAAALRRENPPQLDAHLYWLTQLAKTPCLFDDPELRAEFDDAVRHSPQWAVQFCWPIAESITQVGLRAKGVVIGEAGFGYAGMLRRKMDANAVYQLPRHGLWASLLAGRRIGIVGGQAVEFARCLAAYESDPEYAGMRVTTVITSPDHHQPKTEWWRRSKPQILTAGFDLLLCAAGGLSTIICEAVRVNGRPALDIGQLVPRLLGDPAYNR